MLKDIESILYSEEQLHKRVQELGEQITRDYQGKDLLMIGVLKGSVVFMTDLMRSIDLDLAIDFMAVSSYGSGTTSGEVRILKDLNRSVKDKDILIVEDILDSGRTLSYLTEMLWNRRPASVRICTLLDKPDRRVVENIQPSYVGYVIPDAFVVGYGLDYDEHYRHLPYIGILKPEVYEK